MTEWDAGSVVVFDLGIHPSKTAAHGSLCQDHGCHRRSQRHVTVTVACTGEMSVVVEAAGRGLVTCPN